MQEIASRGKAFPSLKELLMIISTFVLTTFAWIFFRSDSIGAALIYIKKIFHISFFTIPNLEIKQLPVIILICALIVVEWLQRDKLHALEITSKPQWIRSMIYVTIAVLIMVFAPVEPSSFIYFQF